MNDRTSTPPPEGDPQSVQEALAKTCWRQSHEIQSLDSTIEVYRRGASALAAENAVLRGQIASLRRRGLSHGGQVAHAATPPANWVQIGVNGCGLVLFERVVAILYWRRYDAIDVSRPNGYQPGFSRGFWWFSPDRPSQALALFESAIPTAHDWAQARALVARAHSDEVDPQTAMRRSVSGEGHAPADLFEPADAAEPMGRSREWQREELLSRRWLPDSP